MIYQACTLFRGRKRKWFFFWTVFHHSLFGGTESKRERDRKVNCVWFDCVRGGKRETGTYINCQHHSLVCHNLSLVVQFSSLQLSFLSLVCVFIFFYLGNHSKDGIQWNAEGQVALGHPTVVNIRPKMTQDEDSHSLELCEPMPTLLLLRLVLFLFWLASHYWSSSVRDEHAKRRTEHWSTCFNTIKFNSFHYHLRKKENAWRK